MAIRVELFAAFAEYAGVRELQIAFQPGMTCDAVWRNVSGQFPKLSQIPPLFAMKNKYIPKDFLLKDGDSMMIFPPVSGG